MGQHTPGPWHVSKTEHTYGDEIVRAESGHRIACIMGSNTEGFVRDGAANARLIAAAPEMVDLIRSEMQAITRAYIDPDTYDEDNADDIAWWEEQVKRHPFLSRARALLAKIDNAHG
jgi:hypothetical protein